MKIFRSLIPILMLACIGFAQNPAKEFHDGQVQKFSTKGHPKSKGVVFSIKYPSSWAAKEGERPNIVQKFVSDNGKGFAMATISTKDFSIATKSDIKLILSREGLQLLMPEGATLITVIPTTVDGEDAGILEYIRDQSQVGTDIRAHSRVIVFFQKKIMIQISFTVGGLKSQASDIAKLMDSHRILFQSMMNSIFFDDKWK